MYDVTLFGHPHHGGGDVVSAVTQIATFAADDRSALRAGGFQCVLHIAERLLVDQWAYQGLLAEWIAYRKLAVGVDDAFDQRISDRVVNDQPPQGGTALARGARGREHDSAHRKIQIRRGRHDGRVVTAQLEQRPAEAGSHPRAHLLAHPHRPCRTHQRDAWIVDELFADLTAALDQSAHLRRRPHLGGGAVQECLAGNGSQWRQLGWLPHHGVAADKGDRGVP